MGQFTFSLKTMKTVILVLTIFLCSSQALYIVDREVAYLERAIDSAIEAFQVYDKSPTDGKLSYEELLPVPQLAVTEEIFKSGWDLNKDGFLTMAELATVIFKQQLLGPIPNQQREM